MKQPKFSSQIKVQKFSKYDFVKLYTSTAKNEEVRKEKEQEAAIIADAIEETQATFLENLATKDELQLGLKNLESSTQSQIKALELSTQSQIKTLELSTKAEIKSLEYRMTIKLTAIIAGLFTFLPIATDFIRHLLKLN